MSEPYGASSLIARPTIEPVANRVWVVRGGLEYGAIALQARARDAIRRLAALEPREVWAGHADALTGPDVVTRLERAAAA